MIISCILTPPPAPGYSSPHLYWKIEIGVYLAHSHYNSACLSNELNIGLFQFYCHSCFCAFYTTIAQSNSLVRECFYLLVGYKVRLAGYEYFVTHVYLYTHIVRENCQQFACLRSTVCMHGPVSERNDKMVNNANGKNCRFYHCIINWICVVFSINQMRYVKLILFM